MKVLCAILFMAAGPAFAACGHGLALGLDISGSVDATEYQLQRTGLATALGAPAVRAALMQNTDAPVRLFVYEWSSPNDQIVILPWTDINDEATLDQVRQRLISVPRAEAAQPTAIGSALRYGLAALATQSDCARHTLDISADGLSNTGPRPQDITRAYREEDTIVNGLAISPSTDGSVTANPDLAGYMNAYVISGYGAFVETAQGYADYAQAMERKLLRELRSLALAHLLAPHRARP